MELLINEKFRDLIPALTADELNLLTENIKKDGVREPILIWRNTIIDGHNRYAICQKNNISFTTKELNFSDDNEALLFIIKNQLGRRNLTEFSKANLALQLENIIKDKAKTNQKKAGFVTNLLKSFQSNKDAENSNNAIDTILTANMHEISSPTLCQNSDKASIDTKKEIAKIAGVSHDTIFKVKKINANAIDEIKQELGKQDGKISINAAEVISSLPADEQKEIINNLDENAIVRRAKEIKQAKRAAKKEKINNISQELSEPVNTGNTDFIVNNGDIWQAGEHILICGDNTNPEIIDYLKKHKLSFMFADPPYGTGKLDYDKGTFEWRTDYMTDIADVAAVTPGTISIFDFFKATNMQYKWSLACFIRNGMTHGAVGFANWLYTAVFSNLKSINKNSQDVIEISLRPADHDDISFGRQKPFKYLAWLIQLFSKENDYIADIFAGSGSFMLVSEKLNRKSINIEILPELCGAILKRYSSRFKNKEVKKIGELG